MTDLGADGGQLDLSHAYLIALPTQILLRFIHLGILMVGQIPVEKNAHSAKTKY